MTLTNTGTAVLKVTSGIKLLNGGSGSCTAAAIPASWARSGWPAQGVTLAPGAHRTVTLAVTIPASVHSTVDMADFFTAVPAAAKAGAASIGGSVGARVIMRTGSSPLIPHCGAQPPKALKHNGSTWPAAFAEAGIILAALLAGLGTWAAVLRRRHSRR